MAYTKIGPWVIGGAPAISAANLDQIETQYDEVLNLFSAHSILMAIADNDPAALAIAASRIVGRKASGNIEALTGAEVLAIIGRIGKSNLQWTNAKLLLGAGAGSDPTEVDGILVQDYTASDVKLLLDATSTSDVDIAADKKREIVLPKGGGLRVVFELRRFDGTGIAHAQIYRNGGAVGVDQSDSSGGWVTKTEDIAGWSAGDLLQLYTWYTGVASTVMTKDFELKGDNPTTLAIQLP